LPIELLNFNAIAKNKKVELTWSTATEINNDFFTIEKTKDGINFETLSIVDGGGNSTIIIDYFDTDNYPFDGISYYRLKQTDFNGNYTYSQIVPVNYYFGDDGISIFPNPSNSDESITIDFTGLKDQTVLVVVRDIHGKEFYSKVNVVSENKQLVAVDLENRLAAGVYIVIASSSNKIYSQKLIVK
jgi:phenylpyruvate tautomerase PptA (4-oxalocrotonate tautomerase family)